MKSLRIAAVAIFSVTAMAGLVSGSAFAASHAKAHLVYGTVASTATGSFSVTTAAGPVTVTTNKRTKFVAMSAAAARSGFAATDAVVANVDPKRANLADRVRYDVSPFAIDGINHEFHGSYQTDTGTPGTVTVMTAKGKTLTFTTTAATRYRLDGQKVASPGYIAKDRLDIFAVKLTDSNWRANRIWIHRKK
ncbi:MAG TPA: hypothetical protein VG815_08780 [Chloroflexota bacterium]|jgi:hypothetical protein|nr:hypothetical protein [Chloroflexota bacterium]